MQWNCRERLVAAKLEHLLDDAVLPLLAGAVDFAGRAKCKIPLLALKVPIAAGGAEDRRGVPARGGLAGAVGFLGRGGSCARGP